MLTLQRVHEVTSSPELPRLCAAIAQVAVNLAKATLAAVDLGGDLDPRDLFADWLDYARLQDAEFDFTQIKNDPES